MPQARLVMFAVATGASDDVFVWQAAYGPPTPRRNGRS